MATSRILLISNARERAVSDALRASGHDLTIVATVLSAVEPATTSLNVDVVIVHLAGSVRDTVAACHAVRRTEALTGLPILCISETDDVEDRIQMLEAGADDVIGRPFDARELDARVEALAVRLHRSRTLRGAGREATSIRDGSQRRTVAIFSPKGGVGTTTIAVNVATWLASRVPGSTVIIDLDLQFGQVATHLNVTPRVAFADLALDEAAIRDPGLFTSALTAHKSSLQVLGAAPTPDASGRISAASVQTMLTTAATAFQFVVVDAGSVLDARSEAVLDWANDLVVVLTPEFPAIKAVHAFGALLASDTEGTSEISYVLNEIFARQLLRPPDIEEALGTKVALTIPYDAFAFLKSVNEGVPVVIGAARTPAAEALAQFAARLAGLASNAAAPDRKGKGLGGLFGR